MTRKFFTELVVGLVIAGLLLGALFVAVQSGSLSAVTIDGLHAEFESNWSYVGGWGASVNSFFPGFASLPRPRTYAGFAVGSVDTTADGSKLGGRHVYVAVPLWFIAAIFLLPPLLLLRSHLAIRARRHAELVGLCPGCGQDLRDFVAGERCPKCGTLINTPPPTTSIATR